VTDLRATALYKRYPRTSSAALEDVSLAVDTGRTLAIVGPSGAGKSTLLRIIAGLERADRGDVQLAGKSVGVQPPQARRIAMVFQDAALAPHMTVLANLRFAVRGRASEQRVGEVAAALHVSERLAHRPRELSGGERQRVAIGRALLSDPLALLLDEPLAHVDPWLRARIRDDVLRVRERFDGPIVYVTHDHAEAMAVGDVLAVLIDGRIEQIGDPQAVYDAPSNVRVARFLGTPAMNLMAGAGELLGFGREIVGVRPECVRIASDGPVRGRVMRRERTGADTFAQVATPYGTIVVRVPPSIPFAAGDTVNLTFVPDAIRRYDPDSEEIIT
jgi:ABC-type sugar transport system ATPase subunit